jgi:hypothetical protein
MFERGLTWLEHAPKIKLFAIRLEIPSMRRASRYSVLPSRVLSTSALVNRRLQRTAAAIRRMAATGTSDLAIANATQLSVEFIKGRKPTPTMLRLVSGMPGNGSCRRRIRCHPGPSSASRGFAGPLRNCGIDSSCGRSG